MRIGWIGFHVEGIPVLRRLLERKEPVVAVLTLRPEFAGRKSGAADYASLCAEYRVPLYEIKNVNDEEAVKLLQSLALDLLFVIGWTQILRAAALRTARLGVIGAHASLLPHNRGRAPVNWALIRGEKQTGNSLMWLAEDVDGGDLIDQTVIPITAYDTCHTLYERVAESNQKMILAALEKIKAGQRPGRPQPHSDEPLLPGRKPEDGLLDWSQTSEQVYNFVRALTRPYPGAFSWLDGQRWRIWSCAWLPGINPRAQCAEILGASFSPVEAACGQVAACGEGAVILLEVENDEGKILRGRELSGQQWKGKIWQDHFPSG